MGNKKINPFLRWAGGKTWLLPEIDTFLPSKFENYHEPFLGGGSIFIYLKSKGFIQKKSYLSDINSELIKAYQVLKSNHEELFKKLKQFKNEEDFYYEIRAKKPKNKIDKAARFIYLNRTSFNGIYRVNQKGEYNVPFGHKSYKDLFDFENMKRVKKLMKNAFFKTCSFEKTLGRINENDLVFIDPPYTVAHGNNGFIKYNQKLFSWEDQEMLSWFIGEIKEKGAHFILTNADHESIKNLFGKHSEPEVLNRASVIGGTKSSRGETTELIFSSKDYH